MFVVVSRRRAVFVRRDGRFLRNAGRNKTFLWRRNRRRGKARRYSGDLFGKADVVRNRFARQTIEMEERRRRSAVFVLRRRVRIRGEKRFELGVGRQIGLRIKKPPFRRNGERRRGESAVGVKE